MSSSEKDLVQESVREFADGLHSLVPLRHFSEYHEEDKIRKAAQEESNKVLKRFILKAEALMDLKVKGDLLKALCLELEKVIQEHLRKNQECRAKAESFLKKRTDDLCEDFKETYEAKLLLSPDMDLKSAERLLENGKMLALCYFENHSNLGNPGLYEEQKRKLQEKLEVIGKGMLEKHGHLLESRRRKSLEEINKIVLNMSGEIQRDLSTLEQVVSGNLWKAKLVKDYLSETGNLINESVARLHEGLFETLEEVINYLNESRGNMYMSLEDGIGMAKRLDQQLHSYFFGDEKEGFSNETQQNVTDVKHVSSQKRFQPESTNVTSIQSKEPSACPSAQQQNSNDEAENKRSKGQKKSQIVHGEMSSDQVKGNKISEFKNNDLKAEVQKDQHHTQSVITDDGIFSAAWRENVKESSLPSFGHGVIRVTEGDGVLLHAISEGQSVDNIKRILDKGVNVNVFTNRYPYGNAAHVVVSSLIGKKLTSERGLAILNLLVANGFNLINQMDKAGWTPVLHATYYDDLDEKLLTWFFMNGADFNAVSRDNMENSVLLQAVSRRHDVGIIRKILEFGGNPKHVNKWNANVLHAAAICAHESAMEIFINQLDVNLVTKYNFTPLHHLFLQKYLHYLPCLKMLLEKGADFGAKNNEGYVPLVKWMKCCKANPFPTLLKLKDMLPITEEIASATLTSIVNSIDLLWKFLRPSSKSAKEFTRFFTLLTIEKKGKLRLINESLWILQMHQRLENIVWTAEFFKAIIIDEL